MEEAPTSKIYERGANRSKEYWHDIMLEWQASNESQKDFVLVVVSN